MKYREINGGTKAGIRWIVDRMHVGTPLAKVGRNLQERIERNNKVAAFPRPGAPKGTAERRLIAEIILYAREHHRHNRAVYRMVMGGHL